MSENTLPASNSETPAQEAEQQTMSDAADAADATVVSNDAASDASTASDAVTADAAAPVDAQDVQVAQEADAEVTADAAAVAETATADAAATETAAGAATSAAGADVAQPTPASKKPAPGKPAPRKPAPRKPQGPKPSPAAVVPAPVIDPAEIAAAEAFGRVDEQGNVYVKDLSAEGSDQERHVGQIPGAASAGEAMSLYVRRYLDLMAKVNLFKTRLDSADLSVREIDQTLNRLKAETTEPAAVGDLAALREHVAAVEAAAHERRVALDKARAAAKAQALKARQEIVEAAEKIAATDPARIQWRPAGEELRQLLNQWRDAQRNGPRIDHAQEDALWKRFSAARTTLDRERRHYFAELDQRNTSAKAAKEALVAQAEKLSTSTDWGATASSYRDLMTQWKAAGRANRKDDDALWARFRAAQDAFFAARDAQNAAIDTEFAENLKVKLALLTEAEALLPIKDIAGAKTSLRAIHDKWEKAGKVPRADVQRVEARMKAVEQAIRDAEDAQWKKTNPETRARAEGALAQLESAIAGLRSELAAAQSKGDSRKVAELESAITARQGWLEQVARAAADSQG